MAEQRLVANTMQQYAQAEAMMKAMDAAMIETLKTKGFTFDSSRGCWVNAEGLTIWMER
jgi:hypothetical protein